MEDFFLLVVLVPNADQSVPEYHRYVEKKSKLDSVLEEEKQLFLITFQRFCMCISDYNSKQPYLLDLKMPSFWYRRVIDHLKELGRRVSQFFFFFGLLIVVVHFCFSISG